MNPQDWWPTVAVAITRTSHPGWYRRPEIKLALPYQLQPFGDAGQRIVLNRRYKPVSQLDSESWADYKQFQQTHLVTLPDGLLEQIANPAGYLFNDGTAPWLSMRHLGEYRRRIQTLLAALDPLLS